MECNDRIRYSGMFSQSVSRLILVMIDFVIACLFFLCTTTGSAQDARTLRGQVLDTRGRPISRARIEVRSDAEVRIATTDDDGEFRIPNIMDRATLVVSYPGFESVSREITPELFDERLKIFLTPAPIIERINVAQAGEDRIPDFPTGKFSISRQEIDLSGSLALDDALRQAPGFTLFRRSGSLFANPTSQGVSLRGVGANGASRAVVLLDGVPLNSPFGGWIYWQRVPQASVENVEVVNGGTSDVYGSGALGGVVNIVTKPVRKSFAVIESSYGSESSSSLSLDAGLAKSGWGISFGLQALRTDGYVLVPKDQRGSVDTNAGTRDVSGTLLVSKTVREGVSFFTRVSSFGESRLNGTRFQTNDSRIGSLDLGFEWTKANKSNFSLRLYGSSELFNQNFSAVAAGRNSESLTNKQRNPSQQIGFIGQWRRTFDSRQIVTVGIEARDVRGHSAETAFSSSRPTANVDAAGRQQLVGLFGQDTLQLNQNWSVTLGGRIDHWLNSSGFSNRVPLTGGTPTSNAFSNISESAFSPRVSLLHTFKNAAVSTSFYRAFRAPTLNELYRNFRVGNVVTNANPSLHAERLTGAEAGASFHTWSERLMLRGVVFWSEIGDSIANVTLSTNPSLITRQRQNLGRIRARGVEVSANAQLPKGLQLSGEYLMSDSSVIRFPVNVALQGLRVTQLPKHQLNVQFSFVSREWTAGVQARLVGGQFEDDQNTLPLARFFTMDAEVSRCLFRQMKLFVAAQNLTGVHYQIGRTPILTVGPPALVRAGLRLGLR